MSQREKERDPEAQAARAKRIAVGATVAGVLLIIFLVVVLIIQFVQIGVRKKEARELNSQIENYERLINEAEKQLDFYQTEEGLRFLALQSHWNSK